MTGGTPPLNRLFENMGGASASVKKMDTPHQTKHKICIWKTSQSMGTCWCLFICCPICNKFLLGSHLVSYSNFYCKLFAHLLIFREEVLRWHRLVVHHHEMLFNQIDLQQKFVAALNEYNEYRAQEEFAAKGFYEFDEEQKYLMISDLELFDY
ncbi:unnamed protein product [Caenorhabditis brenneri]